MENPKVRQKIADLGVCYFVAPRTTGEEVRYPVTEPVTEPAAFPSVEPVTEPVTEEYLGFEYYERQRANKRLIFKPIFCLIFLGLPWFFFFYGLPFLGAKFGPQPSPEIIPPPPYHMGERIKGLSVKGVIHEWVYVDAVTGWVDP